MSSLQLGTQCCAGGRGHNKRVGQTIWPWLPGKLRQQASPRCARAFDEQCGKHTGLFLQASSQAEAAVKHQHFTKETAQASTICISSSLLEKPLPKVLAALCSTAAATLNLHMQGRAAPSAVRPPSPASVTVRSHPTPFPAAQHARLAEQQQLPEVAQHLPEFHTAQTPPDSLMERWALAVAGQPPAAEHQLRFRDRTVSASTRGAPREQTADAPGGGRASMKRFVKPGLVDRWAQAHQRRQQQDSQVHVAQAPPDSLMERWALAFAGQPPAAHRTVGARTRGAPREQTAVSPGVGRASIKRFVEPGLVDRWAQAQQCRQQQESQGRQPAGRPAAMEMSAAEKQATSHKAAAGKPATPEKGFVAPARTLMDRWGLAVQGIKPLPQKESSSQPATGPWTAVEGPGFAGSKAAAWVAPPTRPIAVQAERFVEPGLMERWESAVQHREAGQQPGSMSMRVWCLAM